MADIFFSSPLQPAERRQFDNMMAHQDQLRADLDFCLVMNGVDISGEDTEESNEQTVQNS